MLGYVCRQIQVLNEALVTEHAVSLVMHTYYEFIKIRSMG